MGTAQLLSTRLLLLPALLILALSSSNRAAPPERLVETRIVKEETPEGGSTRIESRSFLLTDEVSSPTIGLFVTEVPLRKAIDLLEVQSQRPIDVHDDVPDVRITLELENVRIEDALLSIADLTGTRLLRITHEGFLMVSGAADIAEFEGAAELFFAPEVLTTQQLTIPSSGEVRFGRRPAPGTGGLDSIVSVTFRETPLQDAIRLLANRGGLNIVFDPKDLQGTVTTELKDVRLRDALNAILRVHDLEAIYPDEQAHNIVTIMQR